MALGLFVENSYEGTSLQMIASVLGITKPAITYHFGTKEDLLAAVAEPAFVDVEKYFDSLEGQQTTAVRRREALTGYVDLLVRHRSLMVFLLQDAGVVRNQALKGRVACLAERLTQPFVRDCADTGERVYVAAALGGLRSATAAFPELSDGELHAYLLEAGRRMLSRPARRSPSSPE
ncbi:TetR/AcrR family transcriptional regulator [Streptomyces fuscichromogenes]|uniref:TetR family transcriptional regulator n=1 Tax=Streptomyces fuscichromogenes TaxID=1324013 RepID=A0A917XF63_9ACTN|nr:TetR/AcrR family transcriptional regulator [Streptomyces fuscichromogenes]GGN19353.1 TetR family transcriptional regulator [Streptomyces fuscichromogenes]